MKKRAFIFIVLAGVFWGTSGLFFNALTKYGFNTLDMTAMRGVIAALSMSVYVFLTDRSRFKIDRGQLLIFALSGLSVFATATCYFMAIGASSVSTAVVLMYTAPVFVTVFSTAFLGEKLGPAKMIAIILIIAGCVLVSGVLGGGNFSLPGVIWGLSSGIVYSAYNIFTKIGAIKKYDSLSAALYAFIFMGAASLFFVDPVRFAGLVSADPPVILALIFGVSFCTCVIPYFLYTVALKYIPAGTASSLSVAEPVAATLLSCIFLGERLSVYSVIGIILVVSAIIILGKTND